MSIEVNLDQVGRVRRMLNRKGLRALSSAKTRQADVLRYGTQMFMSGVAVGRKTALKELEVKNAASSENIGVGDPRTDLDAVALDNFATGEDAAVSSAMGTAADNGISISEPVPSEPVLPQEREAGAVGE